MKLAEFQRALVQPLRNKIGHKYCYTDLAGVLQSVWEAGNGEVAVSQGISHEPSGLTVETRIFGIEELAGCHKMVVPPEWRVIKKNYEGKDAMSQAQQDGSSITYARRYHLSALLGIVSDEDSDAAMERIQGIKQEVKKEPKKIEQKKEPQLPQSTRTPEERAEQFLALQGLEPIAAQDDLDEFRRRGNLLTELVQTTELVEDLRLIDAECARQGLGKAESKLRKLIFEQYKKLELK